MLRINAPTGEPTLSANTSPDEMKEFVYKQMKREGGWVAQILTARHLYTTAEFADPDNRPNYEGGVAIRGNDYQVLYIIGIVIGGCRRLTASSSLTIRE